MEDGRHKEFLSTGYRFRRFSSSSSCHHLALPMSLNLNPKYEDAPVIQSGEIIGDFVVGARLGEGSYANVYSGTHLKTREHVAIKAIYNVDSYRRDQVETEIRMLQTLENIDTVVKLLQHSVWNECRVLVLPRLGPDFEELWKRTARRRFARNTVCKIGYEVLNTIEAVHSFGILHRSIKLPNICMNNVFDQDSPVILIDMGMARDFIISNGKAVPVKETRHPTYHLRDYSSLRSKINRNRYTPCDDVMQVMFMLLKASGSTCAYEGEDDAETDQRKEKLGSEPESIIPRRSLFLLEFVKRVHATEWEQIPNYNELRDLLKGATLDGGPLESWDIEESLDGIRRIL